MLNHPPDTPPQPQDEGRAPRWPFIGAMWAERLQEPPGQPLSALCLPLAVPVGRPGQPSTHFQQNPSCVLLSLLFLQWGRPSRGLGLPGVGGWAAQRLEGGGTSTYRNRNNIYIYKINESTQCALGSSAGRTEQPLPLHSWAGK